MQTEGDPANMCSHTEIHFIFMFGLAVPDDRKADKGFRYVVCDQLCPYFLLALVNNRVGLSVLVISECCVYGVSELYQHIC